MSVYLRGTCQKKHRHSGDCMHYHYAFRLSGNRYRGSIPEARTKWEAEQAESKIKQSVFDHSYGTVESGADKIEDFIDEVFLPWSKTNKRSWKNDEYGAPVIKKHFEGKALREITPFMIEKFKRDLLNTPTFKGTMPALATVNRHFEMLSRIYTLAIEMDKADFNPCSKVKKFKLDNERYRYLLPEEEPVLMSVLDDGEPKRKHLKAVVTVALGTGLRPIELRNLRRDQVDFARGVVIAARTKTRKNREVPLDLFGPELRETFLNLCKGKKPDDYLFANPKTKKPYGHFKRSFHTACLLAGIENLWFYDLRATFGTRLAEQGYEAYTIMQLMGHADFKTTQRYTRATQLTRRSAAGGTVLKIVANGHNLDTSGNLQLVKSKSA